jgi:hypothetical protein
VAATVFSVVGASEPADCPMSTLRSFNKRWGKALRLSRTAMRSWDLEIQSAIRLRRPALA